MGVVVSCLHSVSAKMLVYFRDGSACGLLYTETEGADHVFGDGAPYAEVDRLPPHCGLYMKAALLLLK